MTGAGSGIGAATARNAAAVGLRVVAWDLDPGAVARTVAEIVDAGGEASAVAADVTDKAAVARALEESATLGELALPRQQRWPRERVRTRIRPGADDVCGSMRDVAHRWLARGVPDNAALVNVASVAGNLVGSNPDWYPAAKAGIMGYTRHLATLRSDVVRANAVAPGLTTLPAWRRSRRANRSPHPAADPVRTTCHGG